MAMRRQRTAANADLFFRQLEGKGLARRVCDYKDYLPVAY